MFIQTIEIVRNVIFFRGKSLSVDLIYDTIETSRFLNIQVIKTNW